MKIDEQIRKAIGAHSMWKTRLQQNIDGKLALDPAEVCVDDRCEFGRWLHGLGSGPVASDPSYVRVVELHKAFHQAAGSVVRDAKAGDKAAATASIDSGAYATASAQLTRAMMQWREQAAKAA